MYSKSLAPLLAFLLLAGCGVTDDLLPSGENKQGGAVTLGPGDRAPEFTMPDIWGQPHTLAGLLAEKRGVVLYFAMWCPICDSHMQSILHGPLQNHPDVEFIIVDYVSGTVEGGKRAAMSGGYAQSPFIILVDERQKALNAYGATMGTTVVIGQDYGIRMIEDYKSQIQLEEALAGL
ncbi:MAG: peroxiredoxin family protein [Nitrospinota bacterium]|nr:peroxiredoxin family protein [Nitrospinota bacterium]